MNFLGHAWYSGDENDEFLAGNVFGDFIKGKIENQGLPIGIVKGITYHRYLDTVGDKCRGFIKLRELLGHEFGHYRGVIADVFIDHLLTVNWDSYNKVSLDSFATDTYRRISRSVHFFPDLTIRVFEYMQRDNWFVRNRDLFEIEKTLQRIENRAGNLVPICLSVEILRQRPGDFNSAFHEFMQEMIILAGKNKLL